MSLISGYLKPLMPVENENSYHILFKTWNYRASNTPYRRKVDYISLKECPRPDIRTYDRIILGTAIYAGSPNRKITQFCHNNQLLLEQKVIGLFICCMNEEQEAEEMNKAFPEFLQRLSIPKAILGGEFQFDKMNFIERFLTKKIAKVNSSVSKLRYDAINEFTSQIKDNHLW